MAIDYSGLFATPEQLRADRVAALQQQSGQIANMGGSMAGLLGQIAAGGSSFGSQMAENLGQGLGLKTKQEVAAERTQAQMKDAMSGNLVKMQNLQKKLSESGNADPRMMLLLEQRINTQRDRVKAEEDRRRQNERAESAESRATAQEAREAGRYGMSVSDWEKAREEKARSTVEENKARQKITSNLREAGANNLADMVENFVITPAEAFQLQAAASKSGIKASDFKTYYNSVGQQITAAIDPSSQTLLRLTSTGLVPIKPEGWNDTEPKISGAPAATSNQINTARNIVEGNPEVKALISGLTADKGLIWDSENPEVFDAAVANLAGDALKIQQANPLMDFSDAVKRAVGDLVPKKESTEGEPLSNEERVDLALKNVEQRLIQGEVVRFEGQLYKLVPDPQNPGEPVVRNITKESAEQALGGNNINF